MYVALSAKWWYIQNTPNIDEKNIQNEYMKIKSILQNYDHIRSSLQTNGWARNETRGKVIHSHNANRILHILKNGTGKFVS